MTSRLDRLFILLESGSSAVTRRAAAKQIGEVQKLHPHELHNLLNRLVVFLHSASWDTRVAAAQAVDAILSNVPQWDPKPIPAKNEIPLNYDSDRLQFARFDVARMLERGARLMGSEGTEFDCQEDFEVDSRENLLRQRALLNERLGFNSTNALGINISDLVTLDDMRQHNQTIANGLSGNGDVTEQRFLPLQELLRQSATNHVTSQSAADALSCRQMNRFKRKARQNPLQSNGMATTSATLSRSSSTVSNGGEHNNGGEPDHKIAKLEYKTDSNISNGDPVPDSTGSWGDSVDWPLETFCSRLYLDLFNPRWETRHGAATALRELLKSHSSGAGKCEGMTKEEMELNHFYWLEDASLRLLCVLALDRFGDFISDQVVAPVRETCAQVLGAILKDMPVEKVRSTIDILLSLVNQTDWEVRHGGLLGIKYMLVVREDLLQTFLPLTINRILAGLFDAVDDVGAVAASTLIPIAAWLPKLLSADQVSGIVKMLWDLLLDQDELTSACNSFMGLLSAILSLKDASKWIQMEPMDVVVPRLWPFLSHTTSSVRRSTLQTLKTLTEITTTNHSISVIISESSEKRENIQMPNNQSAIKLENTILEKVMTNDASLELNFGVKNWSPGLLQEALRHIFQRVLVEHIVDIQLIVEDVWKNLVTHAELSALLHASCPYVAAWMCLAMQPARLSFDPAQMVYAKLTRERKSKWMDLDGANSSSKLRQKMYLGGIETTPQEVRERNVPRARCKAAKMLGLLSRYLVLPAPGVIYTPNIESPVNCYAKILVGYLASRSALQRLISGMIVAYWAECDSTASPGPPQLKERLHFALVEYVYYDEVAISLTRLLQEARDLLATLKQNKIAIAGDLDTTKILTLDEIQALATTLTDNLRTRFVMRPKIADMLEERRRSLQSSFAQTNADQNGLNISTQTVLAGATVTMGCLPDKLNPVIKPIMESIKREECEIFQQQSAQYLVFLLAQVADRNPCPNGKIVTNLCTLLKSDAEFTATIAPTVKSIQQFNSEDYSTANPYHGILTLDNQQKTATTHNGASVPRGPGRPPNVDLTASIAEQIPDLNDLSKQIANKNNRIQRIGATYAIKAICEHFKQDLFAKLPVFGQILDNFNKLVQGEASQLPIYCVDYTIGNELITCLQLVEVMSQHVHKEVYSRLFQLLPHLMQLLRHPLKAIRHMSSRCLAALALLDPTEVMSVIVDKGIESLQAIERAIDRQGASEAIACIVNKLQFKIVPYVILLVVPLLGRMSDPDTSVRLMSTHSFATLIQLMPLDGGNSYDSTLLTADLLARKAKDKEFLECLFTPKKIPNFKVPVEINAELRSYQQSGVNWLWFLYKYKLHGILCDDMGLGKTLQAICILAGAHHERHESQQKVLPSLVICPPTLTGHWVYEVNKFMTTNLLKPLHYVGLPVDRERLRNQLGAHNLVVASYDIVRKDIEFFGGTQWHYVVLDEGHIIKNGKTKSSKAIKCLIANHRLILSGTPIQNNVLELWSLFDFLMPGFLGTEKQFISKFSRPILASRDAKSSPKDQEAGALAMESLHRQVLPFLLRRVKEDVLTDLPPKITQDLLCELSPLQERLYEDFSKSHLNLNIKDCLNNIDEQTGALSKNTHVFQALRYLQNVCNHPKLVLTAQHPEKQRITQELARANSNLDDIEHSAKLPALKQLLLDCGIGVGDTLSVNQHRALIFCQLKAMLDIVEHDLLKRHLPEVSYLRLDGAVPPLARQSIVNKFNNDPSIDVLLLTTQVGGLGLNLTGADTVIFVEHDWNPMKDLQAMDRAHRIGQRKVVNVYRLITRKSLEEKIMGLQKFKLITANTIVSDENAAMETMQTDQLFNLFDLSDPQLKEQQQHQRKGRGGHDDPSGVGNGAITMRQAIENLPELWEDCQYEEEYDLTQFLQNLK